MALRATIQGVRIEADRPDELALLIRHLGLLGRGSDDSSEPGARPSDRGEGHRRGRAVPDPEALARFWNRLGSEPQRALLRCLLLSAHGCSRSEVDRALDGKHLNGVLGALGKNAGTDFAFQDWLIVDGDRYRLDLEFAHNFLLALSLLERSEPHPPADSRAEDCPAAQYAVLSDSELLDLFPPPPDPFPDPFEDQ